MNHKAKLLFLPVLPLRELVIFPFMNVPLFVGREASLKAIEAAQAEDRELLVVAQRTEVDEPELEDLYPVGCAVEVQQLMRMPDGNVRIVVDGRRRVRVCEVVHTKPYLRVRVEVLREVVEEGEQVEAFMRHNVRQYEQVAALSQKVPPETVLTANQLTDPGKLADLIAAFIDVRLDEKQELLATLSPSERLAKLSLIQGREIKILELDREIESKVREEVSDSQRDYFLREKMKQIQERLGERDPFQQELDQYRARVKAAEMTEEAQEKATKELERLEKMPPVAPESTVIRTYLDWLVELPWNKKTKDRLDLRRAERILQSEHYGLEKAKERVLEFLAVRKLAPQAKGAILCFIGPPGVGKTSIGKSIAQSMDRKFIRLSLGGVRDEAEIRGHRRTYIGSMPGRILQTLRRVGVRNPVFMLDEIDKLGMDFRGDPSSALLEALDPEQNSAFGDHYLEVTFDLSDVFFIATGNLVEPMPHALRDRMEVIDFPGYIEEEKLAIGRQYLVPKQIKEHGLKPRHVDFQDSAVRGLVREYTREAGVRNLEREIASICRKIAKRVASGKRGQARVTPRSLPGYLGPSKFHYGMAEERDEIGVATGLAVNFAGGDVLSIEVGIVPGKGKLTLTGQLGDTMQESAQAALSYTRRRAAESGVPEVKKGNFFDSCDIHIHVPSGAVPKDGPSAGIAMATALVSAVTKTAVRKDVAMTGEITLRGKVLPIGGVKEKVLAAHRAGITQVVLPAENEKDTVEIPRHVRRGLKLHFARTMDEVLAIALLPTRKKKA